MSAAVGVLDIQFLFTVIPVSIAAADHCVRLTAGPPALRCVVSCGCCSRCRLSAAEPESWQYGQATKNQCRASAVSGHCQKGVTTLTKEAAGQKNAPPYVHHCDEHLALLSVLVAAALDALHALHAPKQQQKPSCWSLWLGSVDLLLFFQYASNQNLQRAGQSTASAATQAARRMCCPRPVCCPRCPPAAGTAQEGGSCCCSTCQGDRQV